MSLPIETFSSLQDAEDRRNGRAVGQLQYRLAEETSLENAALVFTRTKPGLTGFRMLNPELLRCKNRTKVELERAYKQFYRQCMQECDAQLIPLEAHIAELRSALRDNQIPVHGPPLTVVRNSGFQENADFPPNEFNNDADVPVPERQAARSRDAQSQDAQSQDAQSQRAWWTLNLTLLEMKKRIVEAKRLEMERSLKAEFDRAMEVPSALGVGYADFSFLHG